MGGAIHVPINVNTKFNFFGEYPHTGMPLKVIVDFLSVDDSSGLVRGPQCGREAGAGGPRWP